MQNMTIHLSFRKHAYIYGFILRKRGYIQSICAAFVGGLYEGLDWLSNNMANKMECYATKKLHVWGLCLLESRKGSQEQVSSQSMVPLKAWCFHCNLKYL